MRWNARGHFKRLEVIKYDIDFALVPRKTLDAKWVWLEYIIVRHEYLNILDSNHKIFKTEWNITGRWSQESDVWDQVVSNNSNVNNKKADNVISLQKWINKRQGKLK